MSRHLVGHAQVTIPAPVETVWREACTLDWLIGWDDVQVESPARLGSEIIFTDERQQLRGAFTEFDRPRALAWTIDDGGNGALHLEPEPAGTRVSWELVAPPHALADRLAVGAISLVARSKAQKLTDEDARKELCHLARQVMHRQEGGPIKPEAKAGSRLMVALCEYGHRSLDRHTVPEFDQQGSLVLEPEEHVLWTGQSGIVTAAAAAEAAGQEQFQQLWASPEMGTRLSLTDRRLVYQQLKIAKGDATWLQVGGATGALLAAGSMARAATERHSRAVAGQIRHQHVASLIAGNGAEFGEPHLRRVTAMLLDPPETVIRVNVLLNDPTAEFVTLWCKTIAQSRMRRFGGLEESAPEQWAELASQAAAPVFQDHAWGRLARLPLVCPLGFEEPAS
ncbi:SRPBCC family protein [Streptomyces sp. NPDC054888]